jgi:hypothetical protein
MIAVFSLRTYALYDRSKLILAVIVVPSMGLLGTACVSWPWTSFC